MSFIELQGIEDVKEKELLPVAEYDFVVTDVKGEESSDSDAYKIRVRLEAEGAGDEYQPIWHYLTTPGSNDDADKRYWKLIMIKRFLHMCNLKLDGGFNMEDLMGARLRAKIDASEYEGREGRNLLLPQVPNE